MGLRPAGQPCAAREEGRARSPVHQRPQANPQTAPPPPLPGEGAQKTRRRRWCEAARPGSLRRAARPGNWVWLAGPRDAPRPHFPTWLLRGRCSGSRGEETATTGPERDSGLGGRLCVCDSLRGRRAATARDGVDCGHAAVYGVA